MEVDFPLFPILLCFLLFVFMAIRISQKRNRNLVAPPGPWKFPIIGNIPQLGGTPPHLRLRNLAKRYGPVMNIQIGQVSAVVISSVETAKEVLKVQGEVFAGRPLVLAAEVVFYNCNDILFAPYGDYWRQMRKICTLEFLSAKRVQSFRSVREERVWSFVSFLRSQTGSPVNLTKSIYGLTNSLMLITAIGRHCASKEKLLGVVDSVNEAATGVGIADLFPSVRFLQTLTGAKSKLQRLHQQADRILEEILNEHKANNLSKTGEIDNLLDVLLDQQKNGDLQVPLTNDAIKATILELFGAGGETSSKLTEWAMSELMREPKAMQKAQEEVRRVFGKEGNINESSVQELKYLKLVIKETLRLHPGGAMIIRECIKSTKVNGYDISQNATVLVNVWAIGRDPEVWIEPEKFIPERFEGSTMDYKGANMELIPFGAGKRICPGISLATTYVELLLANLLYHFDWKLPNGITPATLDMDEVVGGTLKRKTDLYLIPIVFST